MNGLFLKICIVSLSWIILGSIGAEDSYCFRFTWMGPSFNNASNLNETSSCLDNYDNCRDPVLVTNDGSPPDFTAIWKSQPRDHVACRLTSGSVCAKWTTFYEDTVEYTMHLCTKITVEGESAMTSGCITSITNNSRRTEVCACKSYPNAMPCNSVPNPHSSATLLGPLIVFFVVLMFVT